MLFCIAFKCEMKRYSGMLSIKLLYWPLNVDESEDLSVFWQLLAIYIPKSSVIEMKLCSTD